MQWEWDAEVSRSFIWMELSWNKNEHALISLVSSGLITSLAPQSCPVRQTLSSLTFFKWGCSSYFPKLHSFQRNVRAGILTIILSLCPDIFPLLKSIKSEKIEDDLQLWNINTGFTKELRGSRLLHGAPSFFLIWLFLCHIYVTSIYSVLVLSSTLC